jgi:hypothetical protein
MSFKALSNKVIVDPQVLPDRLSFDNRHAAICLRLTNKVGIFWIERGELDSYRFVFSCGPDADHLRIQTS